MKSLNSPSIITKRLRLQDAVVIADFFNSHEMTKAIPPDLIIAGESGRDFVKRMLWRCEFCWSVRLLKNPEQIIGFVMLYKWNEKLKEVHLSGFMLPGFNSAHLLMSGLKAAIEIAKHLLDAEILHNAGPEQNLTLVKALLMMGFSTHNSTSPLLTRRAVWKAPSKPAIPQKLSKNRSHRKIAV